MEKYESTLTFREYVVNKVTFKRNESFVENDEGIPIDLDIIPKTEIMGKDMNINLIVTVFEQAKEKGYPFEIQVDITGYFNVNEDNPERFEKNAIAILYPYIRAIVSTYTSIANTYPLTLPAINVNKLIEDQQKETK